VVSDTARRHDHENWYEPMALVGFHALRATLGLTSGRPGGGTVRAI
jgi:hypothetical protein